MFIKAILFAILCVLFGNFLNFPYVAGFFGIFPLTGGLLTGIAFGDPLKGLIAGGYIQLVYIGLIGGGGALPANEFLAGLYGTAFCILSGADPKTAAALAVPIGLLGLLMHNLQMTLDVVFVHQADRYVEEGNFRGIQYMNVVAPFLLNIVLYGIPAFVIIYVFGGAAPAALQAIPQWAINGLNMVGALMPALGIGILLNYLAKREFMPMFLIGYFLAVLLKLNLNALAVFGGLIAAFYYFMKTQPARQGA